VSSYLLIAWLLGMAVYIVYIAERARENKDGLPDIDFLTRHPVGPAVMAVVVMLLSPLWPLFVIRAGLGRLGWLAGRLATALRAWAEAGDVK
jgi:hypothetical protein